MCTVGMADIHDRVAGDPVYKSVDERMLVACMLDQASRLALVT